MCYICESKICLICLRNMVENDLVLCRSCYRFLQTKLRKNDIINESLIVFDYFYIHSNLVLKNENNK